MQERGWPAYLAMGAAGCLGAGHAAAAPELGVAANRVLGLGGALADPVVDVGNRMMGCGVGA